MKAPLILRRVEGHSMWPTLAPDDIVIASPFKKVRPGSVVIAKVAGREYIKRVESVRSGKIRLLGDNRAHSRDSRQFGAVNKNQILGTALGGPQVSAADYKATKLFS